MRTLKQLIYRIAQHIRKVYWRVVKPRTFGAKVLVLSGEQFLLVKHSYEDGAPWTLPGGGFTPNRETVEQAAIREVREELGLSLNEVMVLGSYFSTAEHKRDTVYCITGRTDSRAISLSPEIAHVGWFTRETMPADVSTAVEKCIAFWGSERRNISNLLST